MPAPATPYRISPLRKSHDRSGFSCGSEPLDRYLQQHARQDSEKRVAAPFVLVEPPANRVLGYYTLSASMITADELPDKLAKRLPRYPQLPVILLGRLAVDQSCKGRGLGEFLLMDALRRSAESAADIAAMAVVVDAKVGHLPAEAVDGDPGDTQRAWHLPSVLLPRYAGGRGPGQRI